MPKGGKLKPDEVATLVEWVKTGAKWPANAAAPKGNTTASTGVITEKQREFWSFQLRLTASFLPGCTQPACNRRRPPTERR
jgi:hypothetical protein